MNTYEIRELRLKSLRGDGELVPLCEAIEDVIRETKAVSLENVAEEVCRLRDELEEREDERQYVINHVGDHCHGFAVI